jgi:hypothetical protein
MPLVYIYASQGRFTSVEAVRAFIDPTYTEDGDQIDSEFIREVGIDAFEPMCIEAIHSPVPRPLKVLLEGTSYSEQWLPHLTVSCEADAAICVFAPNVVLRPQESSLNYCGALSYNV